MGRTDVVASRHVHVRIGHLASQRCAWRTLGQLTAGRDTTGWLNQTAPRSRPIVAFVYASVYLSEWAVYGYVYTVFEPTREALFMANSDKGPSKEDWVAAGLRQMASSGIDSVKVERLAEALGISKGPFYWRFSGREELLAGMLDLWKREFTLRLIEGTAQLTPRQRMEELFRRILNAKAGKSSVAQTEAAMRAWAAQDATAARAVRQVDSQRTNYLSQAFREMGVPGPQAMHLARGIYLALLGLFTARRYTPQLADDDAFLSVLALALNEAEQKHD